MIDSEKKQAWCDLDISGNLLTITLPKDFIADAKYPVRLDPTFGYTSAGASTHYEYPGDKPIGSIYDSHTASDGDAITNFHFYGGMITASSILNMAAYSISESELSARLGSSTEITVDNSTPQWWSSSAVSISMSNGVAYGMAFESYGEASNGCFVHYDSGSGGKRHNTAESLPATWGNELSYSRTYSIYITYSESGDEHEITGSHTLGALAQTGALQYATVEIGGSHLLGALVQSGTISYAAPLYNISGSHIIGVLTTSGILTGTSDVDFEHAIIVTVRQKETIRNTAVKK